MAKASKNVRNLQANGTRDEKGPVLSYRAYEVRASSLDIENRTIDANVSTENPVLMPDYSRGEMVPEILVASGAVIPASRQVPLLDSHQRSSVSHQLGSARDVTVRGDAVSSKLHFSESASNEFTKVREGHVTDVSAGYMVIKKQYVPAGETKSISGRSYTGPVNVVTKWKLREVSLTPIGADDQAKLRGFDPETFNPTDSEQRTFTMDEKLKALWITRGMPSTLDDTAAQAWIVANQERYEQERIEAAVRAATNKVQATSATTDEERMAGFIAAQIEKARKAEEERVAAFRKEIDANCELAGMPDAKAHCRTLGTIDEVRSYLQAEQKKQTENIGYRPNIRVIGDASRGFVKEIQTALTMRAIDSIAPPKDLWGNEGEHAAKKREAAREKVFPTSERAKSVDRWKYATPFQMAEEYVRTIHGLDTVGLPRETVAAVAWFGPQRAADMGWQFSQRDAAYHTTGSFANLTLDTINKSMMIGYTEAPSTWEGPMRRGQSVVDFKNISRLRMGAIPNLPVWNDNKNPEMSAFADAREVYAVEARSIGVDYSYRLLVNDDMDALSKTPANMGDAATRTVNASAWAQVTSNPTMSDGVALFAAATGNRKRTNLTTGSGAPSTSTLQTLKNLMMQMRGENTPEQAESADILNLTPRYIVGPGALDTTIMQLVRSTYDPADANMKFNTASQLVPVIEPLLDAASTTAWYLFADPVRIDTVEVSFMQGQESPVIRLVMDERRMSQTYYVMQTFGVKAMNHRGVQKHNNA